MTPQCMKSTWAIAKRHHLLFTALAIWASFMIAPFAVNSAGATIYTININGNGRVTGTGGVDCPSVNCISANFDAASIISLTANPAAGNQFVKWTGDVANFDDTTSPTPTMDPIGLVDRVITASFCEEGVFNFSADPNGSIIGSATQAACSGTTSGPTATPDAGHLFDKWTITCVSPAFGPASSFGNPFDPAPFTGGQTCNVVASFVPNNVNITTASAQANEGFNIQFGIKLDRAIGSDVIVNWSVSGSGARPAAAGDFPSVTGSTTIPFGSTTATINVGTVSDSTVELDETFTITLDSITGNTALIGTASTAGGTIRNNDTATFRIDDVAVSESTGTVNFTVSLNNPIDIPVAIDVSYADVTTGAGDFDHGTDTVNFAAGSTAAQTATVAITDDNTVELDETFTASMAINAGTPVGARSVDVTDTGTGTISSDNDTATFTIDNQTVSESAGSMTFTVSLDKALDTAVTIDVSYADGSATGGGTDYDSATDSVTFPAGDTAAKTVAVAITADNTVEGAETFTANLAINAGTPVGARAVNVSDTGTGTITNDDYTLTVTNTGTGAGSIDIFDGASTTNYSFTSGQVRTIDVQAGSNVTFSNPSPDAAPAPGSVYKGVSESPFVMPAANKSITLTFNQLYALTVQNPGDGSGTFDLSPGSISGTGGGTGIAIAASGSPGDTVVYNYEAGDVVSLSNAVAAVAPIPGSFFDAFSQNTVTMDGNKSVDAEFYIKYQLAWDDHHTAVENAGPITFKFTITPPVRAGHTVTVTQGTFASTATADVDFVHKPYTLYTYTSASNPGGQDFDITINDDDIVEPQETFWMDATGASANAYPNGLFYKTGYIANDDLSLVSIDDVDAAAGEPANSGQYRLTMSKVSSTATIVAYTVSGTATAGSDYVALSGNVTIPAMTAAATIDLSVISDDIVESDETVTLKLTGITSGNAGISIDTANDTATVTLVDDDTASASVSATDSAAGEPSDNGQFTVSLDKLSDTSTVVDYTVSLASTAVSGSDYTALPGAVTIPALTASATINVAPIDDNQLEGNETVVLTLTGISAGDPQIGISGVPGNEATVTISDDDISTASIASNTDGAEPATDAAFRVTLTKPSDSDTVISYSVDSGSTATSGSDYTALSGSVTVPALALTADIPVPVLDDDVVESDTEAVTVTLTGITAGNPFVLFDATPATVVITSEDTTTVTVGDLSLPEGNTGSTSTLFVFTVTLDKEVEDAGGFDVSFATSDNTATVAQPDYIAESGTLHFDGTAGETQTLTVKINADYDSEDDEAFRVNLSGMSNIAPTTADKITLVPGIGTIEYDDYEIFLGADIDQNEGSDGPNTAYVFSINLDRQNKTGSDITATVHTEDDTAVAGDDYTALPVGTTVAIPDGALAVGVSVFVDPDRDIEFDETFLLKLDGAGIDPSNFIRVRFIPEDRAAGIIRNDDTYSISISPSDQAAEGTDLTFTVTLDKPVVSSTNPPANDVVTVSYETQNGTIFPAISGADYEYQSGTLTFGVGEATKTITVVTYDDGVVERNEDMKVVLSSPTSVTRGTPILLSDTGVGTITSDDSYKLAVADATPVDEGSALSFLISLDQAVVTGDNVSFNLSTADGPSPEATATSDYTPVAGGPYTITAGNSTLSVTVTTSSDTTVERDENLTLTLSGAITGLSLPVAETTVDVADGSGQGTIKNDDNYSVASIDDVSAAEGSALVFKVTLSQAPVAGDSVSINFGTSDGPSPAATAGSDYLGTGGQIVFGPGETIKNITVTTLDDPEEVEYDEKMTVTLTAPSPATTHAETGLVVGADTGIGTITDNDKYKLSVNDAFAEEGDSMDFTVSLHQAVLAAWPTNVTVDYDTNDGTAIEGTDYSGVPGTLSFAPGDTTKGITVSTINDNGDNDGDRTFTLDLSNPSADAVIDDGSGEGTVIDNEYDVNAISGGNGTVSPVNEVVERGGDSGPFTFTADTAYCIQDVTRDGASVLGGAVPDSPYTHPSFPDIQNDPTEIVGLFRKIIDVQVSIEPEKARTYGRWQLIDVNAGNTPIGGFHSHGDTVELPCNRTTFRVEYKDVSGWDSPPAVDLIIPVDAPPLYELTGTYVSKTVTLTAAISTPSFPVTETIAADPAGSQEAGEGTHTFLLADGVTVRITANAALAPNESIFLRWEPASAVADQYAQSTDVAMDASKTVTAVFGLPGVDADGDGYVAGVGAAEDCNDSNADIHPDAIDFCGDGIDQDCSGGDIVCTGDDADNDGDGYTENQGDCKDDNAAINPAAEEICGNDVDEDCYEGPRNCGTEVTCVGYSDRPLETQSQSAPPNVLFVLDDSGSMTWSMMTEENDGIFQGNEYIWSLGDNGGWDVLSSSERKLWKSQWGAHNKMYYNPATVYVPWPRWNTSADTEGATGAKIKSSGTAPPLDAHMDIPRSNPVRDDWTLNMDSTFFSVQSGALIPITQFITVERHSGSTGSATYADAVRLIRDDAAVTITADNDDGSDVFSESGSNWSWSGAAGKYDGNARYNNRSLSGGETRTAKWQFEIPSAFDYRVYAWWPQYNNADQQARYTIFYNGLSDTVTVNQRLNGGQWNYLGTYPFTVQSTATNTIEVRNSHYFRWVDHNGDGDADYSTADGADSEVYLVNITKTGSVYDYTIYRYMDDGDNSVEDNELIEVGSYSSPGADPHWDDIVPNHEDGTVRTPEEERQNFANWFSFYRRRELTAKAAIGRTIDGVQGMNVGILGINGNIERTVVPIGVESNLVKIVDNQDGGYSEVSGSWSESGSPSEFRDSSRYTTDSGGKAKWTPTFSASEANAYTVYAWWNCYNQRDENAKFTIVDKDGTSHVVYMDQRQGGADGCGLWVKLGVYAFDETGGQYVTVERHGGSTGSSTNADAVKWVSAGSKVTVDQSDGLLNELYQVDSNGSTPLRRGLQNAGKYFDNEDSGASGGLSSVAPWNDEADGGGCQRAFTILMTDGYYNGPDPSPSVGNEDSDGNIADTIEVSVYDGGVFAGTGSNTLADVAMYYYEKDLHGGRSNNVPANKFDIASHQHMVTYGVSFGVTGTIDPSVWPNCLPDASPTEATINCPTWPSPDNDAKKIDDLYHAAVNGRGRYLSAANPDELVAALKEIIEDVGDTKGTGSSVSINAQELKEGTLLFQASYITGTWRGDLVAKRLNATTGEVEDTIWSAAEELAGKTYLTRKIITYTGSTGSRFYDFAGTSELSDRQKKQLLNLDLARDLSTTPLTTAEQAELEIMVAYLRGSAGNEGTTAGTYRQRPRLDGGTTIGPLGDLVHSAPLHVSSVVYAGANDGMLHAFDDATGEELWAYIPNLIMNDLDMLADQGYTHKYYVDNSPYAALIQDAGGNDMVMLVTTLGKGGKGVVALDISDPRPASESLAANLPMWEYPSANAPVDGSYEDDDMGYGFSRAFVVNSNAGWVVIMGNGYESANGKAMLYVFNALTGDLLKKIDTGVGSPTDCNGLSTPVLIDPDADGKVDYVYAGDLLGNLWKFDLTPGSVGDTTVNNWKVAYNTATNHSGTPKPLFQAKNEQGHRQPITTKPDVMRHPVSSTKGYIAVFGTGRYLGNADFGDNSVQTIYGIWDWAEEWEALGSPSADKYFGEFQAPMVGGPDFGLLEYSGKDSPDFATSTTITGDSSGASATIEVIEAVSDTNGRLTLVNISGTFVNGEGLTATDTTATAASEVVPVKFRPLSNLAAGGTGENVTLLRQNQIAYINELRFMSDNTVSWYDPAGGGTGAFKHAGWYFDLPAANEKMIRDPLIRDGKAFVISSIPSDSPCASGGTSIVHALDAGAGGRSVSAVFDISGPQGVPDGVIDEHDLVNIGTPANPRYVAPSGLERQSMWYTPAVLPVQDSDVDIMYFSTSEGDVQLEKVQAEQIGMFFWREITE